MRVDTVCIWHREANLILADRLEHALRDDPLLGRFVMVDNSVDNRGFSKGANFGARQCTGDILAFLNPDLIVQPGLLAAAVALFDAPDIVIAGEAFDKPKAHYQTAWGLTDWVCGAAMFVRRDWLFAVGGFCEDFRWAWEETDLCRLAEAQGYRVRSSKLPCAHEQQPDDAVDQAYKDQHTREGGNTFYRRWHGSDR